MNPATTGESKRPHDIDEMMGRIRAAVQTLPPAAMFELAEEGYDSLFEQLLGCILSIRTYDEVTLRTARRLFAQARTPAEIVRLTPRQIDELIRPVTFHQRKAVEIHALARRVMDEHGGELPCDRHVLLSFVGVGPKCAHLSLSIACGHNLISVDTHVHRVTNRWGYVQTNFPEQTVPALEGKLPQSYWVEINRLLVPFGKHICTGQLPRCSICPVLDMCQQVGVTAHR